MKKTLVYGTGKSGICAAGLLMRQGREVVFFDENTDFDRAAFKEAHPEFKDVPVILGKLVNEDLAVIGEAVISPGVPLTKENVVSLKAAGIRITGELELGFTYEKGVVAAITGTNGKTTTTSLVGHIAGLYFDRVFVAGNIGDPYTACADGTDESSVTVLEVSSFQLETIDTFKPKVSAILNITPDHLDRHGSMENYIACKKDICKNQENGDLCILNYEDRVLRAFGMESGRNTVFFSSQTQLKDGLWYKDGVIYISEGGEDSELIKVDELNILGLHNYENAMAASALCMGLNIPLDVIRQGLRTFTAVEHRIEFVCEKKGVKYYNDSKATNTDAAIKGIEAMHWPIILIAGGYDKKADYTDWIRSFNGRVKHMFLIGQSAADIEKCAKDNGFNDLSLKTTFEDALESAKKIAREGDCVLLSPACASWGMFKNFEERGRIFKEIVNRD